MCLRRDSRRLRKNDATSKRKNARAAFGMDLYIVVIFSRCRAWTAGALAASATMAAAAAVKAMGADFSSACGGRKASASRGSSGGVDLQSQKNTGQHSFISHTRRTAAAPRRAGPGSARQSKPGGQDDAPGPRRPSTPGADWSRSDARSRGSRRLPSSKAQRVNGAPRLHGHCGAASQRRPRHAASAQGAATLRQSGHPKNLLCGEHGWFAKRRKRGVECSSFLYKSSPLVVRK